MHRDGGEAVPGTGSVQCWHGAVRYAAVPQRPPNSFDNPVPNRVAVRRFILFYFLECGRSSHSAEEKAFAGADRLRVLRASLARQDGQLCITPSRGPHHHGPRTQQCHRQSQRKNPGLLFGMILSPVPHTAHIRSGRVLCIYGTSRLRHTGNLHACDHTHVKVGYQRLFVLLRTNAGRCTVKG